jgi:hypothetical protein
MYSIGIPLVFFMALGIFNPKSAAPPSSSHPPPPSPPSRSSLLELCNEPQLAAYGLKPSDQGTSKAFMGFVASPDPLDGWLKREWIAFKERTCNASGHTKLCDIKWEANWVYLCTKKGFAVPSLEYNGDEDTLVVAQSVLEHEQEKAPGNCTGANHECLPTDIADPSFNCHGDTFDYDEYWIQDPQPILDEYFVETTRPAVGDIAMYRECKDCPLGKNETQNQYCERLWTRRLGELVHSATLDPDTGTAFGKRGYEPHKTRFPVGPGPGTAWDNASACLKYFTRR